MELDERQAGFVEGAAWALAEIMGRMTGDNPCGKSYDPMTVDHHARVMHSYAFDMRDGGRHHPFDHYKDHFDAASVLVDEAIGWIRNDEETS
jgi:hypothetical protein